MASGTISVTGGKEIARALARIEKSVAGGLARGAVGEGANRIRDVARQNAAAQGLNKTGRVQSPDGSSYERRGQIPRSIYAAVDRKQGTSQIAKVGVDPSISESGRTQSNTTPHWIMVEFGSINNPPMPFLKPSIRMGAQAAVAAIIDVLSRGIKRYNKPGG